MSNLSRRLAIIGNPDGWYVHDLIRAATHESIEVISFRDLHATLETEGISIGSCLSESPSHDPSVRRQIVEQLSSIVQHSDIVQRSDAAPQILNNWDNCSTNPDNRTTGATKAFQDYDAIFVRTMPLGSLEQIIFRMNVLHAIQQAGVTVINSPRCLEIAIDKWLTLNVLRQAGLPVPRTVGCQTRADGLAAFELLGGDVVVKPLFGGEGRGIIRVTDPDIAWRVFGTLEQLGSVLYVQEFLPGQGYDIRLLVIGNEIFSVRRHARGDWRTNVSQGGEAKPHTPTASQIELAVQATAAVGGSIVGVDLFPTLDGRELILEVNAVPGWKGTAEALQIDIARRMLNCIYTTRGEC